LFRQQALDYYARSREKSILPRIVRPPVFLFLWLLLALAVLAVTLAWVGEVPIYLSGPGMVVQRTSVHQQQVQQSLSALAFLPFTPGQPLPIHVGSPVRIYLGTQQQALLTAVTQVEPGILSPREIEQRYAPASAISAQLTGPVIVVTIQLGPASVSQAYAGSILTAQIQVGTTSLLSLMMGSAHRGKSP
jgi:hypothetical protein